MFKSWQKSFENKGISLKWIKQTDFVVYIKYVRVQKLSVDIKWYKPVLLSASLLEIKDIFVKHKKALFVI